MSGLNAIDYEKLLKRLEGFNWTPLVFVTCASFIVATIVATMVSYLLMPDFEKKPKRSVAKNDALVESRATLSRADMDIIFKRNIFNKEGALGDIDPSQDGSTQPGNRLVKSDLPVKVVGIIYGGTPYNGLATIVNTSKGNKINSFIVGDILLDQVRIAEIRRRRVILDRDGRLEYIDLETEDIVRTQRQKKGVKTTTPTSSGIAPIAKGPAAKNFKEEGFERSGSEMTMSQAYKQRLLSENFTKVLQDVKATPNQQPDGSVRGFKLTRMRENSIYQKAGLQNDDVVLEINGVELNNAGSAIRLLQSLRNESEIEVLVDRGGSVFPMSLTVR